MRIFLTGATGYIGLALARRLRAEGHEVRALVRATSRAEPLERLGVATFVGEVGDRYSMREAMSGADWVVHAAAELDHRNPPEQMERTNVQGSANVASLAYKLGVGRFLSLSSIARFGGSPADGTPADETTPPIRPFPNLYSSTKHAGQEAIREWERQGLKVNTVYPSLVYGPPSKKGGVNSLLRLLLQKRVPVFAGSDRKTSWVYLDDLVEGLLQVIGKAPPGRDYLLAGEVAPLGRVIARTCELGGVRPPLFDLPVGLARALAYAGYLLTAPFARLAGRRLILSSLEFENLTRHWAFDDSRARRELDWTPRGLEAGLPPTVEFLKTTL
jgi:dihydroflavonol-4-reductase